MNPLQIVERIDRSAAIIFRTARIRIEQTKTSREAINIEKEYLPKIKRLFRTIVKEYEGKLHFLYEAEKRYGNEIQAIIKSMVTKSYFLGIEYISRSVKNSHHVYLSPNDITQIILKSDEAYRMFWRLVTKYLQVKKNRSITKVGAVIIHHDKRKPVTNVTLTDEIFNVSDEEDDRLLDIDTSTALITSGIVTTTIALVTLEKYKEFKQDQELQLQQDPLFEDVGLEDLEDIGAQHDGDTVVFATENDAKVCPDCASLEGEEWSISDFDIVMPPVHPNCRCRLLLKIDGRVMAK